MMGFPNHIHGPWLHLVDLDIATLTDHVLSLVAGAPSTVVRVIRGRKMNTPARLFDEIAAAYQFPYYFGENWDALSDCLNDLSWLPAARYLTIVTDAVQVLCGEPSVFHTFIEVLSDTGREWSEPALTTRPWAPDARPFHVVLQTAADERSELKRLLVEARVPYDSRTWW